VIVEGDGIEHVIEDPRINGVTLTGSSTTGARVASIAAAGLKKQVLELGGSDAFIVLPDADLDQTADMAVRARFQNNGQSCIAAKRFIVVDSVADEFTARIAELAAGLRVGDPLDPSTELGPLAREDQRQTIQAQVDASVRLGAVAAVGGAPLGERGFFYSPTVLSGVTEAMPVFREETFGPVAAVVRASDADHAIDLANATEYGLGASIWTRDLDCAKQLARRLAAGTVCVNAIVASDPRLPIGGVKRSGYGRELGFFGLQEFTNVQTVRIAAAASSG
jgi:succinate-semialdehyde dehydrogenase/glutarate-semialdehyde dehydrogenase